ncbi:MAG: glycosyltransferase family 4 protein [Verrucomicrobia bacterium]|nr:glycosyltransferase family 4 protein [Verrucomicrobiota bacterium]
MKVALLSHYPTWALEGREGYRADPRRHPAPWVRNLAHALAALGTVEVHVVTQTDEIERDMEATTDGVHLHFVACPRRLRAATLFFFDRRRMHRVLRHIAPDVVHAHGTEDAYALAGLTSGRPCVITLQGMLFKIAQHLPPPLFSRTRVIQLIERWCLRRARHIIAKSDYVVASMREIATPAVIHEVPNALNPVFFETTAAPEPERLLFVGIIEERKGLIHLVDAFARVAAARPGARLASAGVPGRGSDDYDAGVRAATARLGLQSRVEHLGFLKPDAVAREMARAGVVIVPSLEEMFCNVAAEAMAVGRPVVATRTGSLPQLVEDGKTGLLAPVADPAALADAIERMLADAPLRARLGAAGREKAMRLWHPEAVARQTVAVYESVLQTAKP